MAETLMTVTKYCNHADLSRTAFYEHKKNGVLSGCFTRKPGHRRDFVVMELADKALQKNVRWNAGARATQRKFKNKAETPAPEPPEDNDDYDLKKITVLESIPILWEMLAEEFSLHFDPEEKLFSCNELADCYAETLEAIYATVIGIEEGTEDAALGAIKAVTFCLAGINPHGFDWNFFENNKPELEKAIYRHRDKLKQKEKNNEKSSS